MLYEPSRMRLVIVCLLALASVGCPSPRAANEDKADGDAQGGDDASAAECVSDDQCVLAAATCCACPTFATSVYDPAGDACSGVTCPSPPSCADNVLAVCRDGGCEVACKPIECALSCADGFAIDATGCVACACAV